MRPSKKQQKRKREYNIYKKGGRNRCKIMKNI